MEVIFKDGPLAERVDIMDLDCDALPSTTDRVESGVLYRYRIEATADSNDQRRLQAWLVEEREGGPEPDRKGAGTRSVGPQPQPGRPAEQ